MFIVLLRFTNKDLAPRFMAGHKDWLQRGFDDGVFLVSGSLAPGAGGGIVAHEVSAAELQARVNDDPFVAGGVVSAEIVELTPSKVDPRLAFLAAG